MDGKWLHRSGAHSLIVFFNGWGMDEHPFAHLASFDYDVYMVCDYSQLSLPPDYSDVIRQYEDVNLVCWSMGVWVASRLLFDGCDLYKLRLAINGTMQPIHDKHGIPVKIYEDTMHSFSASVRERFFRRMCRKKELFIDFLKNRPHRTLENQLAELIALHAYTAEQPLAVKPFYMTVLISDDDRIMLTENQTAFWQNFENVRKIRLQGSHYLFKNWASWDELVVAVS